MPKRFLALDGLRGVCAIAVLLNHCDDFFRKGPLILHGALAVDVFFVLSGFVIALTYEKKLDAGGKAGTFLFSRARRLFPTYWLGAIPNIAIFIAAASAGYIASQDSWWMIWLFIPITTLLMIPDFVTPDGVLYPAMNSVAWSLFAEWVAYILYGRAMFRWKTARIAVIALGGWTLIACYAVWSSQGWPGGFYRSTLLTWGVLRCLSGFSAGVVIYRVHKHELFQRLPVISTEILLLLWFCLACIGQGQMRPIADAAIIMVMTPLLICLLIRSDERAPSYCKLLGDISYPLYVVHPGFIVLAAFTPVFGLWHGPKPLNATLLVLLCIAMAWGVAFIVKNLRVGPASATAEADRNRSATEAALSFN
jgi:peptidoglycan/LPS O-acetylase OafA/YrhL